MVDKTWAKYKDDPEWIVKYRLRKAQYRLRNKEKERVRTLRHFNEKPWYYNAFNGRNNRYIPPWADRAKILAIYKEAYEKDLEVDHIHPLKGEGFCGLHVEYNLQLLDRRTNMLKGNQLPDGEESLLP